MLRRRHLPQTQAVGETEGRQETHEGRRQGEHSTGSVYLGVEIRVGDQAMSNSEDRQILKPTREMVQGAQKWLRINRDLLAPAQILAITTKIGELEQALKTENAKAAASRSDELEQKIRGAPPAQ